MSPYRAPGTRPRYLDFGGGVKRGGSRYPGARKRLASWVMPVIVGLGFLLMMAAIAAASWRAEGSPPVLDPAPPYRPVIDFNAKPSPGCGMIQCF